MHQVSSNSAHSSDISPTDYGISLRPNRVKSYSISNGVLSHSRTANKRVSFSNLHSTNSSQLSLTSSESYENEIYSDEDDEEEEIGYHINPDVNLYSNGDADKDMKDSSIDNIGTENEDEMNRIINLSLDSRLERVIKLWLLTEQRIKDLNIVVTNRN